MNTDEEKGKVLKTCVQSALSNGIEEHEVSVANSVIAKGLNKDSKKDLIQSR